MAAILRGENLKISSKPNAIVMHNPVLGEGFGKEFFDVHPEFSPILHITKGWPPTILSNGTKDKTTPFQYAEKFTRLMKDAGNVCELIPVKDADHSCDWPSEQPQFPAHHSAHDRFSEGAEYDDFNHSTTKRNNPERFDTKSYRHWRYFFPIERPG